MTDRTPVLLADTRILLDRHRGRWEDARRVARVSHSWMSKLARGEISNPTIVPLQRLHDALLALDAAPLKDAAA